MFLGLLQGGDERIARHHEFPCLMRNEFGRVRLFPVDFVAHWRATGAAVMLRLKARWVPDSACQSPAQQKTPRRGAEASSGVTTGRRELRPTASQSGKPLAKPNLIRLSPVVTG